MPYLRHTPLLTKRSRGSCPSPKGGFSFKQGKDKRLEAWQGMQRGQQLRQWAKTPVPTHREDTDPPVTASLRPAPEGPQARCPTSMSYHVSSGDEGAGDRILVNCVFDQKNDRP